MSIAFLDEICYTELRFWLFIAIALQVGRLQRAEVRSMDRKGSFLWGAALFAEKRGATRR